MHKITKNQGVITMPSKKKIKSAARRVIKTRRTTAKKQTTKRTVSVWNQIWNCICWPFRQIAKLCKWFWQWVCGLNVIGMVNIALLVSIIVLFTMLILDFTSCKQAPIVVVAEPVPVTKPIDTEKTAPVLPIKKVSETKAEPVNIVPVQKSEVIIAKRQIAVQDKKKFLGDVVIDSRGSASLIQNNSQINGNLYLQNMNKYTLPCGIQVNGNLFLRDVGLLQFCGEFIVTGNIYVSPRSSFGPIPKTARVGGYVVL